tara:strand:- start:838 stop:1425 length:588 start_codon:yes stop_codon:yes gene_type:complete
MRIIPLFIFATLAIAIGITFGLMGQSIEDTNPYAQMGGEFTLNSDKGEISLSNFRGKIVPIYFGFTNCPDVCITSLNKLKAALKELKSTDLTQIQPIFISVDSERDSPEMVGEYARFFDPSIIGLSGDREYIKDLTKKYFVIFEKVNMENSKLKYTIDHSSIIYIVGRDGKIKSLVHHSDNVEKLVLSLKNALKI